MLNHAYRLIYSSPQFGGGLSLAEALFLLGVHYLQSILEASSTADIGLRIHGRATILERGHKLYTV